jgi:2-polyprenyl-6-hydroxyphenyl methylase/3-demethylubiquinone-9 3-methyltransferase
MKQINNAFYDELSLEWLDRIDHPVALLRAENALRAPWVAEEVQKQIGSHASILDIGCGAGLLTNHLSLKGFTTTGIDISQSSLLVAQNSDTTGNVRYKHANAYALPFQNESFDVVCAMDILEHVEEPALLIAEASRVLKPDGILFFHTFNRNFLSFLLIIKGVEWFVKNTPSNLHVYPLFIRPHELDEHLRTYKLKATTWHGFRPKLLSWSILKLLATRKVPKDFSFKFSKSLLTGYCGIARKQLKYFT